MFQLGHLQLKSNLFLSPLAGYTNLPFRLAIREVSRVDLCTTDLVNARSLIEQNPKALKLIETNDQDSPLSVQLFGGVKEEMRDASILLQEHGVNSIDVNMGCPVPKVTKTGGGASMMNELPKTQELIRAMVEAVDIPITAKMRLGWDDQNLTAPDLAQALEDAGVSAIFVHGRTRAQGFEGVVNLEGIRKVVEAVREIPVIGNGDVTTPEAAKHMIEKTGCHGVSAGRGPFTTPGFSSIPSNTWTRASCPRNPVLKKGSGSCADTTISWSKYLGKTGAPCSSEKLPPGIPSVSDPLKHSTLLWFESVPERILNESFLNILTGAPNSLMNQANCFPVTKCLPWLPPSCWKMRSINPNREKPLRSRRARWKSGKSD